MEKKKGNRRIVVIGCLLIALAVMLVLSLIFVPRIAQKSTMKKLLGESAAPDAKRVLLGDAVLENESPLGAGGAEVVLGDSELTAVRNGLNAILENGFGVVGESRELRWDIFLRTTAKTGSAVQIYFAKEHFYYYKDGTAFLFAAKDAALYSDFYAELEAIITKE